MPTIYPSPVSSPAAPNSLSGILRTKDSVRALPVMGGEIMAAGSGEKAGPANTIANGFLKIFLSNPEALLEIFQKGQEAFNQPLINRLLPATAKSALVNAAKIIDSLLFSPKSLANPLFLKDYVAKLGLRLEGDWQDFLQGGKDAPRPAESLKSVLLKLAGELTGLLKGNDIRNPEEVQKLTHLAKFTEASLRAIETQQMINVPSLESESKYLLQIPLLFPEGVRAGEIFIEPGKNGPAGQNKKSHVVMFLSMDKLGDMVVDAFLSDNNVACVFKFTDPEAEEYFSPLLAGLGIALRRLGYGSSSLASLVVEDLTITRQDCHRAMLQEQDAINLFA